MSESTSKPASLVPEGYDGRFRTFATILESPAHGPQLCHLVENSLPPQGSGPEVAGWDWGAVDAESASGTTWGSYVLVGTFDGETFTLSEPAVPDDGSIERPQLEEPMLDPERAPRSEAELQSVQSSLTDLPGMLSSYPDVRAGQVVVELLLATQERQRELDERFGAGTVRQHGALVPID